MDTESVRSAAELDSVDTAGGLVRRPELSAGGPSPDRLRGFPGPGVLTLVRLGDGGLVEGVGCRTRFPNC